MSTSAPDKCVLVSWVARNNDPYERDVRTHQAIRDADGKLTKGPTLNFLFDPASPYRGRTRNVVLLYRHAPTDPQDSERDQQAFQETQQAIAELDHEIRVEPIVWQGDDPTDHAAIFEFLSRQMETLRRKYEGRELVIHVSPGTPSMHCIWVLMAECGFIQPPFTVVKSYRERERQSHPPVAEVRLDIGMFYKRYLTSRPARASGDEQRVIWDRSRFRSPDLIRTWDEATRYAKLKVPILILGERGTGKTTLASWIRMQSPFRDPAKDRSWPSVPCGQYTPETMRSELFGHTAGAFTDATAEREGLLKQADGDTLFLDEVGDVGRDVQRLLIRALEERQYQPLGSDKSVHSDFRLLSATNRPWQQLKRDLDADFLDRISAVTISLPPLREIREDLAWLWDSVLAEASQRANAPRPVPVLATPDQARLIESLQRHMLPGNLRDLFTVAYRLLGALTGTPPLASDPIAYALDGLRSHEERATRDVARAVAHAFADEQPLDPALWVGTTLTAEDMVAALQKYLGVELLRIARERGIDPKSAFGVTDRTLRNWKSGGSATSQ